MSNEEQFESPLVAVDAVIFTVIENKLNVLLIKIKYGPFVGFWGVPGGKVRIDETLDDAARRELFEKTGLKDVYLEQLFSFGKVTRDPRARIISVAYFALVDHNRVNLEATGKYEDIGWFPVHKLTKLAYDHNEIVNYALF
ncbi:MAG: NUDIX hydrolase, partial [Minisyncoccia bacterium]